MTGPEFTPEPRLIHFETLDSTNEEARRLADAGEKGPLWIWSDVQTRGRGRHGRSWVSEKGNLFVTALLTTRAEGAARGQLSFVAALAVHDAASRFAEAEHLRIKWPNDLLLDGAKFCGVLVEAFGRDVVGIGMGVNLDHAPDNTPYPVTCLRGATPRALLDVLMPALMARVSEWDDGAGFATIRQGWLKRAAALGNVVDAGHDRGVFCGLADDGALLLRSERGDVKAVRSGEVSFPSLLAKMDCA